MGAQFGHKLYAINNLAVIGFSDCGEEGCLIFRSEFERLAIVGTYHGNPRALLKRCAIDYNLSFDYLSCNNSHLADFNRRYIVRPTQDAPIRSNLLSTDGKLGGLDSGFFLTYLQLGALIKGARSADGASMGPRSCERGYWSFLSIQPALPRSRMSVGSATPAPT